MLLISLGTGPFSVGACPWSLCTTAKDKHTLNAGPVIHHRAGRKGTGRPRQMCLFFLSFHLPWLDISSCGEAQRPSQENKVMPALTDYTVPSVKRAIEGRSENPASAWAAGNPLSAVALARWTITNVLVHETKSTQLYNLSVRSCTLAACSGLPFSTISLSFEETAEWENIAMPVTISNSSSLA